MDSELKAFVGSLSDQKLTSDFGLVSDFSVKPPVIFDCLFRLGRKFFFHIFDEFIP